MLKDKIEQLYLLAQILLNTFWMLINLAITSWLYLVLRYLTIL